MVPSKQQDFRLLIKLINIRGLHLLCLFIGLFISERLEAQSSFERKLYSNSELTGVSSAKLIGQSKYFYGSYNTSGLVLMSNTYGQLNSAITYNFDNYDSHIRPIEVGDHKKVALLGSLVNFDGQSQRLLGLMLDSLTFTFPDESSFKGDKAIDGLFLFVRTFSSDAIFFNLNNSSTYTRIKYNLAAISDFQDIHSLEGSHVISASLTDRDSILPFLLECEPNGLVRDAKSWRATFIEKYSFTNGYYGSLRTELFTDVGDHFLFAQDYAFRSDTVSRDAFLSLVDTLLEPVWVNQYRVNDITIVAQSAVMYQDQYFVLFDYGSRSDRTGMFLAILDTSGAVKKAFEYSKETLSGLNSNLLMDSTGVYFSTTERINGTNAIVLNKVDLALESTCHDFTPITIDVEELPMPIIESRQINITTEVKPTGTISYTVKEINFTDTTCGQYAFKLPKDTVWCQNDGPLVLNPAFAAMDQDDYQLSWEDGSTSIRREIKSPGKYWMEVVAPCCNWSDTVEVLQSNLAVSLPTNGAICADSALVLRPNITSTDSINDYSWNVPFTDTTLLVNSEGEYIFRVENKLGCVASDTFQLTVNPLPQALAGIDDTVCLGDSIQLNAEGTGTFRWLPADGLNKTDIANPIAKPNATIQYTVLVTDTNSCRKTDSVLVVNAFPPNIDLGANRITCDTIPFELEGAHDGGITRWMWQPDSLLQSFDSNVALTIAIEATSLITLTGIDTNGCKGSDSIEIEVLPAPALSIEVESKRCLGDAVSVWAEGGLGYQWLSPSDVACNTCATNSIELIAPTTVRISIDGGVCGVDTITKLIAPHDTLVWQPQKDTIVQQGDVVSFQYFASELVDWSVDGVLDCEDCASYSLEVNQSHVITTMLTDAFGCQYFDLFEITPIDLCPKPKLPNAFSPNGDGVNDAWEGFAVAPNRIQWESVTLWNKWGQEVYTNQLSDEQLWDGLTRSGTKAPVGVYTYQVTTNCFEKEVVIEGTVMVVR